MPEAIVIGAGVGGLAAALALQQRGWDVQVFERAPALENVGAGLAMQPNALRVLDRLGVAGRLREMAALQGAAGIRRPDGRWITRVDATAAQQRYGLPTIAVHRAALVGLLADALAPGTVRFGVPVTDVDSAAGRVTTTASSHEADLVVAADGINSAVRKVLFPSLPAPVYTGVTSWRFIVGDPPAFVPSETWGRGQIFGIVPLGDGRLYCYATAPAHAGASAPASTGPDVTGTDVSGTDVTGPSVTGSVPAGKVSTDDASADGNSIGKVSAGGTSADGNSTGKVSAGGTSASEQALLGRLFGGWHAPIPELIAAAGEVIRTDIRCLDQLPPQFHAGRVALLGDAAHAMTPNLGQGACQAIEDAYVLAARAPDLARYSAERVPRTAAIVSASRRVARLSGLPGPVLSGLRNAAMSLAGRLGPDLVLRQTDPVLRWEPPEPENR